MPFGGTIASLSFRDVEGLLAERAVSVSYEAIRSWCSKFGPSYAHTLRRRQGRLGDIWHVDEHVIVSKQFLDILVTRHRDRKAAKRFFRKILKHQEMPPRQLVTDKLRSYPAAHRDASHQHTRGRERQMRGFKSAAQVQRFLSVHSLIHNLFRVARHRLKAIHSRLLRERAFTDWREAA